jgi:hypothetical protein
MVLRLNHQPAELQLCEGKVAAGAQEHLDLAALFYSHLVLSLIKEPGIPLAVVASLRTRFPPPVFNSWWKFVNAGLAITVMQLSG